MLRAANSLFRPLQTELQNRQIQSENRATALSIHAMVMDSIGILTNLCFGAIAAWNLSYAFGFGGLICLFYFRNGEALCRIPFAVRCAKRAEEAIFRNIELSGLKEKIDAMKTIFFMVY